ncbi:MAG TPA: type II secretion system protein [Candidatus Saccharimonadales bacterium]|nr:type II secretion system protein [Candidatus Saccharimonadales bacterium]
MSNIKKRSEGGFTIIEVLIVLAIAGLIMLIVFLAVPALQRNSRNTQRKNDVSALLAAVQEYINNNSGALPTTAAQVTANAKLGFYTGATDVVLNGTSNKNVVNIVTGAKCNGNAIDTTNASARNVAAVYYVESSSGTTAQCQES